MRNTNELPLGKKALRLILAPEGRNIVGPNIRTKIPQQSWQAPLGGNLAAIDDRRKACAASLGEGPPLMGSQVEGARSYLPRPRVVPFLRGEHVADMSLGPVA